MNSSCLRTGSAFHEPPAVTKAAGLFTGRFPLRTSCLQFIPSNLRRDRPEKDKQGRLPDVYFPHKKPLTC